MSIWKKARKVLLEWTQMVVFSITLAVLINLFLFQPVRVEGQSMQPTLQDRDLSYYPVSEKP